MNARSGLLIVAALLGLGGVLVFRSREASKPALSVREQEPPAREQEHEPPAEPRTAAVTPSALPSSAAAAAEKPSEDSLAAAMHALEDSAPERALELARRALALWPAGTRAPEFAATEVKCLYRLGKPSEGRGAAEAMVNKYPGSPWALEVEKQTGAHPYVNH